MKLLKPIDITPDEMGEDIAKIIPGTEPPLHVSNTAPPVSRIPIHQDSDSPRIIPVCEPTLTGKEKDYLMECIDTNWISSAGRFITEFENAFANKCHCQHGIACSNGTVAIHLALAALGIGAGDEVIIPTFTMIATINAVAYTGATPVLVDSEPKTWNMDMNQVADKISSKTKVIIPVHTYGHAVDMDPLMELADKHGICVIEDAAEAHGGEYKNRRVGSLGHGATFSFYANKNITTGEGGMVTTNHAELAKLCRNLRDHAFSEERHFWHKYLGYNYRMTNLQAAVGLAQTEALDDMVAARRRNAKLYTDMLADVAGIITPPEAHYCKNTYWMYGVLVNDEFGMSRDELRRFLASEGIETRTFFIPMHFQPIYYQAFKGQRYHVAENLCRRGFYYPSASSLTQNEIRYITSATKRASAINP